MLFESVFSGSEKEKLTRSDFTDKLTDMEYKQQLGGPYLSVPDGQDMECEIGGLMFDLLSGGKEEIGWRGTEKVLRVWSGGEEGITWDKWWAGVGEEEV